ncbi:uncharacterized protein LY89DRAFT_776835 [Mollisia scopiformis]|uniref:Uncharacterized protein n=1 Tax=Mollisia scopiformis TaxID=149040 RepID=A0A194XS92_MOLSC|nr:uncharacterized protein LY89DRAFT_776835 [Mollisia scopiformis]KUJ23011.1 hypothetical protein LY89DRAFT_776835 [Mollisia scopiformis]
MKFIRSVVVFNALLDACITATDTTTYVGVRYEGHTDIVLYTYGECYPYQLPTGENAQLAVWCRPSQCYDYVSPYCLGSPDIPPPPLPGLPFVPGEFLPDPDGVVELIGGATVCDAP